MKNLTTITTSSAKTPGENGGPYPPPRRAMYPGVHFPFIAAIRTREIYEILQITP